MKNKHIIAAFLLIISASAIVAATKISSTPESFQAVVAREIVKERVARKTFIKAFRYHNPSLSKAEAYFVAQAVIKYADLHDLSPTLIASIIIIESHARPEAVSPKGAIGLMQVMPHMGKELAFKGDLFDIDDNVRLGTFILADNIRRWGFNEGVSRYFWGVGRIRSTRYLTKVKNTMGELNG